jgi:hypothetical protein
MERPNASLYMERDITQQLAAWRQSPFRKPLILKGARQVGKTRALRAFGQTHYTNVAYVSLERVDARTPSEYASFFETTKDPRRIVANLSLALGVPIAPETTLLVLDEIQDCPAAVGSLKYFCDDAPEYHVACAGSLLGVALASEESFPVGKVTFLDQRPMTFSEYLRGTGEQALDDYCRALASLEPIPPLFESRLTECLRAYFATGGMPEAVGRWAATRDMSQVDRVLSDLVDSYERDFAKHGGRGVYEKISLVWSSLPSQLARENKKFLYGLVKEGARAREYENAIVWLRNAGLVHQVLRSDRPGVPVSAYDDVSAFKLYCLDVGVLRRLARMDAATFAKTDALFREFKGAFAENYVLQALLPQLDGTPRYWTNDKPKHEVDFVVQIGNRIVPVEVKSGQNVTSASLRYYANKYPDETPLRVRFSLRNLSFDGSVLNVPLYLADQAVQLVRLAQGSQPSR